MPTPPDIARIICTAKIAHKKYTKAEVAAKRLRRKFEKYRYRVYRCWICQAWHVGRVEKDKDVHKGSKDKRETIEEWP